MVFLGLGAVRRVVRRSSSTPRSFPSARYVVVENTVVNGRPVASGFGPGPHEAVVAILGAHRDSSPTRPYERYTLTFNRNGFLQRMR